MVGTMASSCYVSRLWEPSLNQHPDEPKQSYKRVHFSIDSGPDTLYLALIALQQPKITPKTRKLGLMGTWSKRKILNFSSYY